MGRSSSFLIELQSHLTTKKLGRIIQYENLTSSTQTLAHEWAKQGAAEGAIVLAEGQLEGRGRSGNYWVSPMGTGIWMSLILRPQISIKDATHFTLLTSLGVKNGIRSMIDLPILIKWPNDLLIRGKKVCGILTEIRSNKNQLLYMIVGIGINVNTSINDWPVQLQHSATSLAIEEGATIPRMQLLASILYEIEKCYDMYLRDGFQSIKEEWELSSGILGKLITTETAHGTVTGIAQQLTDKGELIVQTRQGKIPIHSPYIHLC